MILWARVLCFIFAFQIDVSVRAAEVVSLPEAAHVVQRPAGCLATPDADCILRTGSAEKMTLQVGAGTVILDENTLVRRQTPHDVWLISGQIWVLSAESLKIRTEFGDLQSSHGDFWVARNAEKVKISATGGAVEVWPRGYQGSVFVVQGQENWLKGVGRNGYALMGFPMPLRLSKHIVRWARLYPSGKRAFRDEVYALVEVWKNSVKDAAQFHEQGVSRKMASLQENFADAQRARARQEEHNRRLRELYRKKVLFE